MRQVLYLFISGFLAFLSCTQDKIQMVSLGIDDVYYLPRMKTYLLSPAFTGCLLYTSPSPRDTR